MSTTEYLAARVKLLTRIIIVVSIAIPAVVGLLLVVAAPEVAAGIDLKLLPRFHAILNSITALLLITSYVMIRQGKVVAHKTINLFALLCSVLFLVSYLVYHSLSESTSFGGEGTIRYLYYFVLISHIILAVVIVPMVLFTFLHALTGRFERHRKLARWTLPLWLYVAITGVVVYLMISPYYGT